MQCQLDFLYDPLSFYNFDYQALQIRVDNIALLKGIGPIYLMDPKPTEF
jgi:hypothetical protein